mgnify:CR=1 FL=1
MSRIEDEQLVVAELATPMLKKFRANSRKPHWDELDARLLLKLLREEVDELAQALDDGTGDEIALECADVANFAAMLAWKATRGQIRPASPDESPWLALAAVRCTSVSPSGDHHCERLQGHEGAHRTERRRMVGITWEAPIKIYIADQEDDGA